MSTKIESKAISLSDVGPKLEEQSLLVQTIGVLLGVAILGLLAQVKVYLPFTPVPVTGQTFGVVLISAMMGKKLGPVTSILYVLAGAFGAPIYAGGASGWAVLSGATAGYLVGFPISAWIVGSLAERGWTKSFFKCLATMMIGLLPIFVLGVAWLTYRMGFILAIGVGLIPFLPGAAVKTLLATAILQVPFKNANR
ncbi:MAG: biotin transporter BioY [Bdellovibrionales bacterium]|nr:biotin transporter BioY [Bdellovibrionales bacterium]